MQIEQVEKLIATKTPRTTSTGSAALKILYTSAQHPRKNRLLNRLCRMHSATLGRISSRVHPKAPSSRNSWPPKSVQPAAVVGTPLLWTSLHEAFTVQLLVSMKNKCK